MKLRPQPKLTHMKVELTDPRLLAILADHHIKVNSIPAEINPFRPTSELGVAQAIRYEQLKQKWCIYVEENWYGFSLEAVPLNWLAAINDMLDYVQEVCPGFKIKQIKLKFGGLRIYLGFPPGLSVELPQQIQLFAAHFFDKKLIY